MTKRFTPTASDFTKRLADTQASIKKLKARLAPLEAAERDLKAFLMPYYDQGETEVSISGKVLTVNYAVTERTILNGDRVRAMYAKLGKKVPEVTVDVITFKVNK